MQIKVSSAVVNDFNQLKRSSAPPRRYLALPCRALPAREKDLPRPSLLRTYIAILLECYS